MIESLVDLLFGDLEIEDRQRWESSVFEFSAEFPTILAQRAGGPCSVLSCVQCELFMHLISIGNTDIELLSAVTKDQALCGLQIALANMIGRCAEDCTSSFCVVQNGSIHRFRDRESLLAFISAASLSVCEFVLSLLATRCPAETLQEGLAILPERDEMSAGMPLVARFGFAEVELLNLCLHGRAVSGVHDGSRELESGLRLGGVPSRSPIGHLTFTEALQCLIAEC